MDRKRATSAASATVTGVDATHSPSTQWLNTNVEVSGCQLTLSLRSPGRLSGTDTWALTTLCDGMPCSADCDEEPCPTPTLCFRWHD